MIANGAPIHGSRLPLLNPLIVTLPINKPVTVLACSLRNVLLHVQFSFLFKSWFGVEVETANIQDEYLIEDQGAKGNKHEAHELKPEEFFLLAIELKDHKEDPYDQCSCCVYGRSLSTRSVLGDCNPKAVEKGHSKGHCDTQPNQGVVRFEVTEGLERVFYFTVGTKFLILAWDVLKYR
jgi:hypothetical protein